MMSEIRRRYLPMMLAVTLAALAGCRGGEGSASDREERAAAEAPLPMVLEVAERHALGVEAARGLAVHPAGGLIVAHGGGLLQLDGLMQSVRVMPTDAAAVAVAVDRDGRIFAAELHRVLVFDAEGRQVGEWRGTGVRAAEAADGDSSAEKSFIAITAIVPDGDFVRVADAGARAVFRLDRTGDYADMIGGRDETGRARIVCPSPFLGIGVDSHGLLVIGNPGRHRMEYYDRNHRLVRHWGRPGEKAADFPGCCNPTNVAVMDNGRVVVSEKGVPRVKVYDD